jgi:glycosyltransferase involved in cell wall biosynthesis
MLPRRYQLLGCPPGLEPNSRTLFGKIQLPLYIFSFFIHLLIATIKFKPKLIHANWAIPAGLVSWFVGKLTKTPVIVTVHGADAHQRGFMKSLIRFVLERMNHVVVVSNYIKRLVLTFSKPKQMSVVENVVDLSGITKVKQQVNNGEARKKLRIKDEDKVVMTVRRLVPEKRVQDLVEAAELVLKHEKGVIFIIGGAGPELANLKRIASDLGIKDNFRFLGPITEREKLELLSIADICVQTSVQEGLSLALLEFMASGTVVISTSAAGQSEIIKHGVTGFLFPPADIEKLSELLLHSLTSGQLDDMKRQASEFVFKRFPVEKHTQGYLKVYSLYS